MGTAKKDTEGDKGRQTDRQKERQTDGEIEKEGKGGRNTGRGRLLGR